MSLEAILAARDRHSITDVLERFGVFPPSRWNGTSDYMINCPAPEHDDTTPSCVVHPQTDRYLCFGCGVHGDVLQLVQDVTGTASLRDAAAFLDGETRPAYRPVRPPTAPRPVPRSAFGAVDIVRTPVARVREVNQAAWRELTSPQAERVATQYLRRRGLDVEHLQAVLPGPVAGYTPARRDGLVTRLLEVGFFDTEIVDAGWARVHNDSLVDRFHRRVVFPVISNGTVRGVIGRDISGIAQRRYLNSPTTVAYAKAQHLYAPLGQLSTSSTIVICEGPLDALALTAAPSESGRQLTAVATAGTALTARHVETIRAVEPDEVIVMTDADQAGDKAAATWIKRLAEAGLNPRLVRPPEGLDPAAWLTSGRGEVSSKPALGPQL